MGSNRISIDYDKMSERSKQASNYEKQVGEYLDQFIAKTKNMKMGAEVRQKLSTQMKGIKNQIDAWANSTISYTNQISDGDIELANKLENELKPPKNFLKEDATKVNEYEKILVGKIDGRSVNEGEAAKPANEIDESVVKAEGLMSILGAQAKEEKYDDSSIIQGESILGNINGDVTQEQEYDDTVNVNKSALRDITKNATEQQELSTESSISGESILGNINKNVPAEQQEYDAGLTIAAPQTLGTMDNNSMYQDDLDQKAMAIAFDNFAANEFEQEKKKKKVEDELEHVDYDEFENTH